MCVVNKVIKLFCNVFVHIIGHFFASKYLDFVLSLPYIQQLYYQGLIVDCDLQIIPNTLNTQIRTPRQILISFQKKY